MAFKILTLNDKTFAEHCRRLRESVADSGFEPEVVVSIPKTGNLIAQTACSSDNYLSVTLIRHTKGSKAKGFLKPLLKKLPRSINNFLRKLEARYLMHRKDHMESVEIIVPRECMAAGRILVIDDAVDTGATLKAVVDKIKAANPNADVRSAVMTITSAKPLVIPDYYLYNNRTLIRFPWSVDN